MSKLVGVHYDFGDAEELNFEILDRMLISQQIEILQQEWEFIYLQD